MWFDNPFFGNNKNNVNVLLHGIAKNQEEAKNSTTVDIWRGNYSDYSDKPKPRLTIMKTATQSPSEIAITKTLPPDAPDSTSRTLLCHHATEISGHIKCNFPGRCKEHKLSKPSSFEVSRLDRCRSVIELYDQKVMPGVIGAQQQISRNKQGNNYQHLEFQLKSRCQTHAACGGTCATHRQAVATSPSKAIKTPSPSIRAPPKQMIMSATSDQGPLTKKQAYSPTVTSRTVQKKLETEMSPKRVTFNNEVMVKCINPHCGRTSVTGVHCTADRVTVVPKEPSPPPPPPPPPSYDMPSCYYQHLRGRMDRLKQKEEDDKMMYAPPSSLATPISLATSADRLVKKYNVAKNNCIRRKKFVIPVIDPDCLYLPNNVKPRPRPQRPIFTSPRSQSAPVRAARPSLSKHSHNMRNVYPRRRISSVSRDSSIDDLEDELDRRAGLKRSKSMTSIPIGCDADGPLIYSVSGGKVVKISRMKAMEEYLINDDSDCTKES